MTFNIDIIECYHILLLVQTVVELGRIFLFESIVAIVFRGG